MRGPASALREKMLAIGGGYEGTSWTEGKGIQQMLSSGLGMSGWMDEWINRCIGLDGWMDGQMNGWVVRMMCVCMGR